MLETGFYDQKGTLSVSISSEGGWVLTGVRFSSKMIDSVGIEDVATFNTSSKVKKVIRDLPQTD